MIRRCCHFVVCKLFTEPEYCHKQTIATLNGEVINVKDDVGMLFTTKGLADTVSSAEPQIQRYKCRFGQAAGINAVIDT